MIGSGGDFGPAGPGAGEAPPFAVAGPSQVTVDASRSGAGSFTVSNVTGRPVRARVLVLPGAGADASWFEVQGESERALPVAGTTTVDVSVRVPEGVAAGAFSFVLGAALEESPDQVVSGPTATFQVPEPNKRKFPWWIVIVAAAAVLLLAGGGFLVWNLTRPDAKPTPPQTPTPSASSIPPVKVTVTVTGQGTVRLAGTECTGDCTVDVPPGIELSPTQEASFAHVFDGWAGDCPTSNDCTLPATGGLSLQATFGSIPVSSEDCVGYNKGALAIVDEGASGWLLTDGGGRMLKLDNEKDAKAALAVAKLYSFQCFVGRPQPELTYWKGGEAGAPVVADPDCISHDPANLKIAQTGAAWRLTDGNHQLATLSSEADAGRALMVARQATQRCFVGRGNPPAETSYWIP